MLKSRCRKMKNRELNRYVYDACARRVDPNLTEQYISEIDQPVILQELLRGVTTKLLQ